jgi:hypothetical protein
MMRSVVLPLVLLVSVGSSLAAQDPEVRRERLRQQVMERFMENYRGQAGLSDEQYSRFRDVTRRSFEARNRLNRRERELWRALEGQMRPGMAANADSVARILDELVGLQAQQAEQQRLDQQAYAEFLSPVQRAQLTLAFRRLQLQIEQVVRERMTQMGQ